MVIVWSLAIMLLLCKTFSEDINDPECGLSEPVGRIVDGRSISRAQIPWMVELFIFYRSSGRMVRLACGGSVISASYILTAAHCVQYEGVSPVMAIAFYNSTFSHDGPSAWIEYMVSHPQFDSSVLSHDIALAKVERPFIFDRYLKPVCLPTERMILRGSLALVAGWGFTQEGGTPSRTLMYMLTNILHYKFCKVNVIYSWQLGEENSDNIICTIHLGGGTCKGDSGGALTVWYGSIGRSIQVGIVSYGTGCARPYEPAMYTRVDAYVDWIRLILQEGTGARLPFAAIVKPFKKPTMLDLLYNSKDDALITIFA